MRRYLLLLHLHTNFTQQLMVPKRCSSFPHLRRRLARQRSTLRPQHTPSKPPPAAIVSTGTQPAPPGLQPRGYRNAGLFAQEANARRVQAQLLNANLPAFRQRRNTAQGQRFRVRVGPFGTRQEATAARTTLRGMALQAEVFQQ